ncbi:MAG: hypothetical protein A2V67_03305 [Deltaproteobacteria bacterium RBG_13_61_14]|nr:MAG: hypothetical protein A2V67_03305 [Deltaproteobacteria bacterium RBG_13_61_14]
MIREEDIQALAHKIGERFHPQKIILFGSWAYGSPEAHSDVDLLIIQETALPPHRRGLEIRKFLWPPSFPMDILVLTPAEVAEDQNVRGTLINLVLKKGRVLYG